MEMSIVEATEDFTKPGNNILSLEEAASYIAEEYGDMLRDLASM